MELLVLQMELVGCHCSRRLHHRRDHKLLRFVWSRWQDGFTELVQDYQNSQMLPVSETFAGKLKKNFVIYDHIHFILDYICILFVADDPSNHGLCQWKDKHSTLSRI